ncbi:cytochrome P450 CYP82D47 [Lactuca sativa]|uniref:Cytochrome P450 n=1 Tax=Lactuca sativa TaxID=4236 RepID=A0A9R1UW36_LACSA|nr:cytochrome P450 CYP82D47 [Lactuca sativa]KAJ0195187.1 hypothetical protein LSAT_V11C700383100 [Lactuca sativa]
MELFLPYSMSIAAIFFAVFLQILKGIKSGNKGKNRKAPEAKGKWPVVGHLHLLGGPEPHHITLANMADKYGPIFTIKLGVHNALVVSNSEIAKECFTKNDKAFSSRPKLLAVELMGYNYAIFALAPYGAYWRQVRKIIMLEVLSTRRVEMLGPVRSAELRESMKDLYDVWVKNKDQSGSLDMVKVDMQQWFGNLVLNSLIKVVTGKRFALDDEEGIRFRKVANRFFQLLGGFVVSDYIPPLKFLDIGGYKKEMIITGQEMDNFFDQWLEEYKRERESKQQNERDKVLMDVLISILEGASEEEFPGHDHATIIKATCLTMVIGGLDSTSVALTWALCLLLNNPRTLKLAQEEIDEHVGRKRRVEESDLKNLVYMDAILKETLRLYPPGHLGLPKETLEDCIVQGYYIPKGTRVMLNLWKLHRDPNIWPNPTEFLPERFLTTHKDVDLKGHHFDLLPFGSGRRVCPGILFAMQATRLALASLIQQFELKSPSSEPVDMKEIFGVTCSKATPLEVLIAPRLPLDMYPLGA